MKAKVWVGAVLTAGVLALAGCGKGEQAAPGPTDVQAIDATKFRPAFASANPEIKTIVDNVMTSIQGSMYPRALADLDKLASDTSLTDPQKKVVKDLSEQIKKKVAADVPKPVQ